MRQAVRVGRQILLPRIRSQGKTRIQRVAAVSSTNVWALGAQRLVLSVSNASLHWDGSSWSLELLTFLPNQPRQRRDSCDGLGVGALAGNCPDCRLANLDRWTGEMALPRELGAFDGPVFSDVSYEKKASILKRIFEMYASGDYSLTLLQKAILEETGLRINRAYLEAILKSTFYIGNFVWRGVEYKGT